MRAVVYVQVSARPPAHHLHTHTYPHTHAAAAHHQPETQRLVSNTSANVSHTDRRQPHVASSRRHGDASETLGKDARRHRRQVRSRGGCLCNYSFGSAALSEEFKRRRTELAALSPQLRMRAVVYVQVSARPPAHHLHTHTYPHTHAAAAHHQPETQRLVSNTSANVSHTDRRQPHVASSRRHGDASETLGKDARRHRRQVRSRGGCLCSYSFGSAALRLTHSQKIDFCICSVVAIAVVVLSIGLHTYAHFEANTQREADTARRRSFIF